MLRKKALCTSTKLARLKLRGGLPVARHCQSRGIDHISRLNAADGSCVLDSADRGLPTDQKILRKKLLTLFVVMTN
jgi:hypothetical protein